MSGWAHPREWTWQAYSRLIAGVLLFDQAIGPFSNFPPDVRSGVVVAAIAALVAPPFGSSRKEG